MAKCLVRALPGHKWSNKFVEEIGVDGQIIDHVTDFDLENDFCIKLRLHRVKIIEGIKKL